MKTDLPWNKVEKEKEIERDRVCERQEREKESVREKKCVCVCERGERVSVCVREIVCVKKHFLLTNLVILNLIIRTMFINIFKRKEIL